MFRHPEEVLIEQETIRDAADDATEMGHSSSCWCGWCARDNVDRGEW